MWCGGFDVSKAVWLWPNSTLLRKSRISNSKSLSLCGAFENNKNNHSVSAYIVRSNGHLLEIHCVPRRDIVGSILNNSKRRGESPFNSITVVHIEVCQTRITRWSRRRRRSGRTRVIRADVCAVAKVAKERKHFQLNHLSHFTHRHLGEWVWTIHPMIYM